MNSVTVSEIKIPHNFYKLSDEAVAEELASQDTDQNTKREIWEKMGNELEIAGFEKDKISVKIQSTIEGKLETKLGYSVKINTAYYYRVMAKNTWQDQNYTSNNTSENITTTQSEISPLGELENSSIYTTNTKIIDHVKAMKVLCDTVIYSLKNIKDDNNKLLNIEDVFTPVELTEYFTQANQIKKIVANTANSKTIVPQNAHGIFKDTLRVESGLLNVAKIFLRCQLHMIENIKKTFLTKKQAGKFAKGTEPNPLPIFIPKSREEAIFMDFFGLACVNCSSWRVLQASDANKNNNLKCVDCNTAFPGYTVSHCAGLGSCGMLFYLEELHEIVKTGHCPGCSKKLYLPKNLVEYANEHLN